VEPIPRGTGYGSWKGGGLHCKAESAYDSQPTIEGKQLKKRRQINVIRNRVPVRSYVPKDINCSGSEAGGIISS
jgi:hypothetical protein